MQSLKYRSLQFQSHVITSKDSSIAYYNLMHIQLLNHHSDAISMILNKHLSNYQLCNLNNTSNSQIHAPVS